MSAETLTLEERAGDTSRSAGWLNRIRSAFQAQEGALFAWTPVCLVAGIWFYFSLSTETAPWVLIGLVPAAITLAALWVRDRTQVLALALCLVLAGFCLAKLRTEWVWARVLPAATGEINCEGRVVAIEPRRGNRVSLTVAVSSLTGVAQSNTPARVRLLARVTPPIAIGDIIKARCRLMPPPGPVAPGAFDFARTLWFEGIGATGRVIGDVTVLGQSTSIMSDYERRLQSLRILIGEHVRRTLSGDIGAIGEALITGDRAEISREANSSLQTSGLAHVLSISGLHMSLVAGGVFALVRGLLALSPGLALRYPIKKWAALAALLAGFAYMLLSGSAVATQRSYIMLAIMFVAILLDRPALSTRNLAIAGLAILIIEPEAAVSASFQMSFLAVVGLVAFYDAWHHWKESHEMSPVRRQTWLLWVRRGLRILALAAATTLIAGILSSIPAIYHFGRASPYSLLANLLSMPVIGLMIMPMAVASVVLMPLGCC